MSEGSEMGTIERAFQLAREGACHSINDIRKRLLSEGYPNVLSHTAGMSIKKQLNAILAVRGAGKSLANDDDDLEP
jgi:hypothetical protein